MRCRWFPFALAVALAVGLTAAAQPPAEPKDGKSVVPLNVDAVATTRPALKHHRAAN